jgi:hypothetical protein
MACEVTSLGWKDFDEAPDDVRLASSFEICSTTSPSPLCCAAVSARPGAKA